MNKPMMLSISAAALLLLAAGVYWLWTPDLARSTLESRYGTPADQMVTVAGTRLHIRDEGPRDAPTLVMIHGFGSSLQTWDGWAERLTGHYRVVRLDLPGSGLSPPDSTGVYTDARSTALVLGLMDRLDVDKATFIGNSIGGRIAWTLAAEHPQRVDKLVLISPDGFASPGADYGRPASVPATLSLMRYVLPRFMVRSNLAVGYGDPNRLSAATVTRYYDLLRAPGARAALLSRLRQTVLVDPVPLLRRIHKPVLLLWGGHDRMIPIGNAADYEHALPDVQRVALPALGHVPQEEMPARSLAPVIVFLAGNDTHTITR